MDSEEECIFTGRMNYLDISIAIPILYGLYKGATKGLVVEISALLALVAGVYGGLHFSDYTASLLAPHFNLDGKYTPIVLFTITFLVIVITIGLLGKLLTKLLKWVALGFVNRALGAVFGALKMTFIVSVVLMLLGGIHQKFPLIKTEVQEQSLLYGPVSGLAPLLIPAFKRFEWQEIESAPSDTKEDSTVVAL